MNEITRFDCIIVGGGLSGLTTTLALSKIGLSVAIIDKASIEPTNSKDGDQRTTAISASGKAVFEALGIWDEVKTKAEPILNICVSEKGSEGLLTFDHREAGPIPMGHIVENIKLKNSLILAIKNQKNITLLPNRGLKSFSSNIGHVGAHLDDESFYTASLLIAADGRNSSAREMANIKSTLVNYRQSSIVFTVTHTKPHKGIAYEQFLAGGPIAFLPMRGKQSSVVWSEDTPVTDLLMELSDEEFSAAASYRLDDCLGRLKLTGKRRVFPLSLNYADTLIGDRFAMVGDAAHGLHPIAGQGFNLGLRDVANLVEEISRAQQLGLDIGSFETLRSFQATRRLDNFSLVAATDGLNKLFSNNNKLIRAIRSNGLSTVNSIAPLKKIFMEHAMGTLGNLPSLLQGKLP